MFVFDPSLHVYFLIQVFIFLFPCDRITIPLSIIHSKDHIEFNYPPDTETHPEEKYPVEFNYPPVRQNLFLNPSFYIFIFL